MLRWCFAYPVRNFVNDSRNDVNPISPRDSPVFPFNMPLLRVARSAEA
jgi:hypothetical protein